MSSEIELEGFDLQPAEAPRREERPKGRKPGKIYTFYSFKGGVGRSMALANIAVLVAAQGKKVLIVDFDLEAPGLEHFFYKHDRGLADRLSGKPGVIDLLGAAPIDWTTARTPVEIDLEALSQSRTRPGDSPRQVDIIHSGRASRPRKDYTEQVQRLNWTDLYKTHDIGTRFGRLRAEWIAEYDYIFIDSRTGVTDIGDLCTVVLPDHLVLLFVTNQQNIEGVASIYHRAVTEHRRLPFERSKLTVLPVLSRDEFYSENKLSREWRQRAADELSDLFQDWLPEDLRPIDAFQKIFIPYFAIWSFGEALPVLDEPDAAANPSSINASYARIARLILHDLDWASLDEIADPAEVSSTRILQRREIEEERKRLEEEIERERAKVKQEKVAARGLGWASNLAIVFLLAAAGFFGWSFFSTQNLETEIARLQAQSESLERERATADALQKELEQARVQLEARGTILVDARTELEKTRVELENAHAQNDQLQEWYRSLVETKDLDETLRQQIVEIQSIWERQNEVVSSLEAELTACSATLTQTDENYRNRVENFRSQVSEMENLIEACQAYNNELRLQNLR